MSEHERRMMIANELVDAASRETFSNINPATGEVIGDVADGGQEDMDRAITAARAAFDTTRWSTDKELRKRCLQQFHDALHGEREEFRSEIVEEVGAPLMLGVVQVDAPINDALLWPKNYIDQFEWERELGAEEMWGAVSGRTVVKEATGVVGAIAPWNYPLEVILNKVGPALATGNTVVLKPAQQTPFNATRLGRIVAEKTDIPPGVFNVVTSSNHLLGEELVVDPRVDLISFTGSTATGTRIMEKGAPTLKRLFLELGGKSAHIILEDANLEEVLPGIAMMCGHAGQGCVLPTRWLVPRSKYEIAQDIATAAFEGVPYGDPSDPGNLMGPLISEKQRARVLGYIDKGKREGGRLLTGGSSPAHLPKGYFVEPTLFAVEDHAITIAQEEIFGPVIVLIPFDDDDDAVRIANDSKYGLGGAVSSGDIDHARAVARRVRAGAMNLNGGNFYGPASPFGGYKMSGLGRQCGREGFEQYLETKVMGFPA